MDKQTKKNRKQRILQAIYGSFWGVSMAALAVVAAAEIFMVYYAVANTGLYGDNLWKYHGFYLSLMVMAIGAMALNLFVRGNLNRRCKALRVANPLFALFFFAWSLGLAWWIWKDTGAVNPTLFMAITTAIPLCFYLFPAFYAVLAILADAAFVWLFLQVSPSVEGILNLCLFFVLQLVLGTCFLQLKRALARRIVGEEDSAGTDEMTGFGNRSAYEKDLQRLEGGTVQDDLVCVAIDINGLKDVNDTLGLKAGDDLILGQVECINQCFGSKSRKYRIGGDEFVVLLNGTPEELQQRLDAFEQRMRDWSGRNGVGLNASYGYVFRTEFPEISVAELAKLADERMYSAKARYYQTRNSQSPRISAPSEGESSEG